MAAALRLAALQEGCEYCGVCLCSRGDIGNRNAAFGRFVAAGDA
jgi:hypothetical protein